MKLVGANPNALVTGLDELPGKSNYFLGNDPKKWHTNVANYRKVKYEAVYPGIDLVYYGNQRQLEYDFVVSPGADPRAIALAVQTGNPKLENRNAKLDANGDLVISTDAGELRFHKPVVYQPQSTVDSRQSKATDNGPRTKDTGNSPFSIHNSQFVEGRFVLLAANRIGFEVLNYDKTRPLVIDPVLTYSTYLGGTDYEVGADIAVDASGNAYVLGETRSTDFPTSDNAWDSQIASGTCGEDPFFYPCSDLFITKLNADGSALLYSTYLGGTRYQQAWRIAVDSSGHAYVAGLTSSDDFPTVNAFQSDFHGGTCPPGMNADWWVTDAFVVKVSPEGSALIYSTYLGGSEFDGATDVTVDGSGNAYVTGSTLSGDYPTVNALQPDFGSGWGRAFVSKLNADGTVLVYSTYLGGSGSEGGAGIAVDGVGAAYVTGSTVSADFPTTSGSFQSAYAGGTCGVPPNTWPCGDGFVAKLNPQGSALSYSTYLGGSGQDYPSDITVDLFGSAYLTGTTYSSDFPTTAGALQTTFPVTATCPGGGGNAAESCAAAFVTKLNADASALQYSTYLGGSEHQWAYKIAVDSFGSAYVIGWTYSPDFPIVNPFRDKMEDSEGWISKVNANGSALIFSSYVGGSGWDTTLGLAMDSSRNIYLTGTTGSTDFPTTPGVFQATPKGWDAFVIKIDQGTATPAGSNLAVQPTDAATGNTPVTVTFDTVTEAGHTALRTSDSGTPPPIGFSLGNPPTYYELNTTALYAGNVTVCINYAGIAFAEGTLPQLFHFEGGAWVDRTSSLDTVSQIICASVSSFSAFAIFSAPVEPTGLQPPLAALVPEGSEVPLPNRAFKQGSTVPLKLRLFAGSIGLTGEKVPPPQIVALWRSSDPIDLTTLDLDAGQANDNGTLFRFSDGNWVYNLSTAGLSPGTYTITIQMPDGRRWNAGFVLR